MARVQATLHVSERRACRALEQPRSSQRYQPLVRDDEAPLTQAIVSLASQFGRCGYRWVARLLRREGWHVNHKRVERIWRAEGLKVPENSPNAVGYGSTMGPVFACVQNIPGMCGVTILSRIARTMGGLSAR